jgi:hypothetical protein
MGYSKKNPVFQIITSIARKEFEDYLAEYAFMSRLVIKVEERNDSERNFMKFLNKVITENKLMSKIQRLL